MIFREEFFRSRSRSRASNDQMNEEKDRSSDKEKSNRSGKCVVWK